MPKKKSYITVTDQFCGAGGSSQGAKTAGCEVKLAMNHWKQCWKNGKKSGKYRMQYMYCCPDCSKVVEPYYYAAFNCIDWSDIGTRIGDRKKPLSPNTIRRIEYGLKKYGNQSLSVVNYTPGYCKPLNEPIATVKTVDSNEALLYN